jgi:mono/diheme cytochrome c family protein
MRLRWVLLGLFCLSLMGAAGFMAFASQPAMPLANSPDKASFDAAMIARGAELAMIGDCNVCHTKAEGMPYAGGRALQTPFGTIYATNITPDVDTGIGGWSEATFLRAMREGVRRDGAHLYPVFPYDHFTKVATSDLRAIYAFLMTREAVRAETPPNALRFPFSMRMLIAAWKVMFFKPGELQSDPVLTAELNRGAYLVEGLGHCGGCHTPRNALGAERNDAYLAGGESEGWSAPALNDVSTTPVAWTDSQLFTYLYHGFAPSHGVAAGPMQPVANNLGRVAEADVKAIADYIARVGHSTAERGENVAPPHPGSQSAPLAPNNHETITSAGGRIIYAGACASCHEASGQRFSARGIGLASSKVITMPDARNLAHVILEGIPAPQASPAAMMPGFADALTDTQVVALMNYLREAFSDRPAWRDLESTIRQARRSSKRS